MQAGSTGTASARLPECLDSGDGYRRRTVYPDIFQIENIEPIVSSKNNLSVKGGSYNGTTLKEEELCGILNIEIENPLYWGRDRTPAGASPYLFFRIFQDTAVDDITG